MLSKAVRVQNKNLVNSAKAAFAGTSHSRAAPTIFHKALNIVDSGTTAFSVSKHDPTQVLEVSSSEVALRLNFVAQR